MGVMDTTLSIGDFSRMSYLSVRTLRRYHESGLLVPVRVDSSTGYRYYSADQLPAAQVIRRLRTLQMPLEDIGRVLSAPDVAHRDELIAAHLTRMEEQLEQTREAISSLRLLLGSGRPEPEIEFRTEPAQRVLAITGNQPLDDALEWFTGAFDELHALVPPARRTGPDGALYFADFFEAESGRLTVFVPTDVAAAGRAHAVPLPEAELAVATHDGALQDLDRTYGALGTYVTNHAIGVAGPIRERFLGSPSSGRHLVEVGWPIFRT